MAHIFIHRTYTITDSNYTSIVNKLEKELNSRGHNISTYNGLGEMYNNIPSRRLDEADAVISIGTQEFKPDPMSFFMTETARLIGFMRVGNRQHFTIAIGSKHIDNQYLSIDPKTYFIRTNNDSEINKVVDDLIINLNLGIGESEAKAEIAKEEKKAVDESAASFANKTIDTLTSREKNLRLFANSCFIIGFLLILTSIGVLYYFSEEGKDSIKNQEIIIKNFSKIKEASSISKHSQLISNLTKSITNSGLEKMNWSLTVYFAIKSLIIVSLLLAASKYAFTLAKAYMVEALKIADRVHAIRFGQFYLQVYNSKIEPSELKDAFSNWNISNTDSAFHNQKSDDWDPKYIEKALEIIEKVKGIANK